MKSPFRSIRWRLLLWHSLVSLALVVAVAVLADRLVSKEKIDGVDQDIRSFERGFFRNFIMTKEAGEKGSPPSLEEIRSRLEALKDPESIPAGFEPGDIYIAFWDNDGFPLFISKNAPSSISLPAFAETGDLSRDVSRGALREHQRRHPTGLFIVIGRDISPELSALGQFRFLLAIGGASLLVIALFGSWWLAGRSLRPVETISQTASRIAAGNLTERIATSNSHTELDQLGHVLNDTFERLAALIEQQKRFTADASHELRTPLTVIISETQRALKRDRDPEEYKTIITHCQTAAKRMHSLVNSLLLLARQDTETDIANQPTTDLAAVASSAAAMLAPLAAERSTKIQQHLSHAPVAARPEVLEILLQNLLGNAISHTPEGTLVTVRTSVSDGCVLLEVHDNGPGIPPEHLPHLFDRFYRADAARTQGSGHSGLGLAIVQSIVKTLHGRIEVESSPSIGTTFKVSFNATN